MTSPVNNSSAPPRAKATRKTAVAVTNDVASLDAKRAQSVWDDPRRCPKFSVETGHRWPSLIGLVEHKAVTQIDAEGASTTRIERSIVFPLPCFIAERHVDVSSSDHRQRVRKTVLRYIPLSLYPAALSMSETELAKHAKAITLDAKDWTDCTWPDDLPELIEWSDTAQAKSKLREALRVASRGLSRTIVSSGETGWVRGEDGWIFVTGVGAIGASGPVSRHAGASGGIADFLAPFDLGAAHGPVKGEDLDDAFELTGVLPVRYSVPAFGTVCWSIVAGRRKGASDELDLSSGLATVFGGESASGKSLTSAAMWSLLAEGIDADHLPGPQGSERGASAVGLGHWLSSALGIPATIDDVPPENIRARERLAEAVRSVFNAQATLKGSRNGGLMPSKVTRATLVVSIEDAVMGQSIRNRALFIPFVKGQIKAAKLGEWMARRDGRRRAMAGFVAWVASRRLEVADEIAVLQSAFRLRLMSNISSDSSIAGDASRVAAQHARSLTGIAMFFRWAVAEGLWPVEDAQDAMELCWAGQWESFVTQLETFAEGSAVAQIRRAFSAAMDSGRAHVATTLGQRPTKAQALGWHGEAGIESPRGALAGWTDGETVWLSPDVTGTVVREMSAALGSPLSESADALGRRLASAGLLGKTDAGRNTSRAPTVRRHGWPVSLAWLLDESDGAKGSDSGFGLTDPGMPPMDWPTVPLSSSSELPEPEAVFVPESMPDPEPEVLSEPVQPIVEPAPVTVVKPPTKITQRPRRDSGVVGVGMDVTADEIREMMRWAEADGPGKITPEQAHAALTRWHDVTGIEWSGTHGVIGGLLRGHTRWPGAKTPKPADLSLFHELKKSDDFWSQRSWIVTPGTPAEDSMIVGADVNAQYVAGAASVELGEGNPEHWEPGEILPNDVLKRPGWVRLKSGVKKAPHGLDLPAGMWVPTPLAQYLTRDCNLKIGIAEALVWPERRKALGSLAGHFRDWRGVLSKDSTPEGRLALAMLKNTYAKALGGYLGSTQGLTPPEWSRPDWAALLKAQSEANALRALDKLPDGCIVRAKFADAVFVEIVDGSDVSTWPNIDSKQPGKWKVGPEFAAPEFADCSTPEAWRATYAELTKAGE